MNSVSMAVCVGSGLLVIVAALPCVGTSRRVTTLAALAASLGAGAALVAWALSASDYLPKNRVSRVVRHGVQQLRKWNEHPKGNLLVIEGGSYTSRGVNALDGGRRVARVAFAWMLTQGFVFVTWVPFRAENFKDTQVILKALAGVRVDKGLKEVAFPIVLLLLPLCADHVFTYNPWILERLAGLRTTLASKRLGWLARTEVVVAVLGLCFAVSLAYVPLKVQNFIYFQF